MVIAVTMARADPVLFEIIDILRRGVSLRCPCCGYGHLFKTWLRTHDHCQACGERFEREPGQWFGAVYVNLGLSALLGLLGCLVAGLFMPLSLSLLLRVGLPVAAMGPILFFRLSKGIWTSIIFLGEGLYLQWPNQ